ncbi:hypothetical protein K469DRAFT_70544 [Zopfia rhizophila CBS 207.26]|uniref:Uncharacterized protein n=1 Tax=Zopfia rhizophila CBS 207.26 TaxID=1314779 RepID=A0A6A6EF43_9PEZI|nr:hypothetical protein K469DRAFT_70544 [Zopfia rhizophila CBS 207.26]
MSQSKPKAPSRLQDSATGWKQITDTARRLKFQKELARSQSERVRKAVELVAKRGLSEKPQKLQRFLDRVLEISPDYFLLCAITLSQNVVTYTKGAVLDDLLDTIATNKENGEIIRLDIRSYAVEFNVPGAVQLTRQNETLSAPQEAGQRDGTVAEVAMSDAHNPQDEPDGNVGSPSHTQEQEAFENASRGGIDNISDKPMCDAIRGVAPDSGSTNETPPNETNPDFATAQRAVATFEGVIFFAAQSISGLKEREAWISSCLNHLHLLKLLSCINEGERRGTKRKRGAGQEDQSNASDGRNRVIRARSIETTEAPAAVKLQARNTLSPDSSLSQPLIGPMYQRGATEEASPGTANFRAVPQAQNASQVEASDMNMALTAVVAKLESILGGYLFEGVKESRIRHREKDRRSMTFTDAVRLHLAYEEGEDFKLEVWLCSSIGKAISEANKRSVKDLRNMLGEYLFEAMKASNRRKEEERMGMSACTGAVDVSFPSGEDSSDDSKLEVILNFERGWNIWAEVFPS